MSIRVCQNSFSKGILSPSLQARVDLGQYPLGVKDILNGIVLQEGCVINRPGLEFISEVKYSDRKTRLIPFVFNLSQSYILEFGNNYIRFIKDGGYILDENNEIYEITSPYSEEALFELDYVQQADVMTIVHKDYKPHTLSRFKHNHWELEEITFNSAIKAPNNVTAVYSGSLASNTTEYEYVVCAVDKTTKEESTRSEVALVKGHLEAYWTTSEYITINWQEVDNAMEYNIYRSVNGVFGYVGTSTKTSFKDNNIEPDLTSCAPIYTNPFEEENPSCVCYYQQRKLYASSSKQPQTLWASQSGTNDNFNISRPLNASDAITLSLYDNMSNSIRHLIPFDNLIAITTNSEWSINGSDGVFCANPLPVAKIQSYYGASKVKPVISGSMVLFVQSGGNMLRDLGYSYLSDSYDGEELTLFANHLFEGKQIVDMAYAKEPYRIVYCIMNDGTINALTYNPKQKITAWHRHLTNGAYESVAVIRENNEDIAYFIVKRKINDNYVRYIERFKSRTVKNLNEAFFLDCALHKQFSEKVEVLSNLNHLKNTKVCALLDNGVVKDLQIDQNGTLKLPYPASNILVGLPYEFRLETLNLENQASLGVNKVINCVEVKILNSREDFYIENANNTLCQNARSHDSVNNPDKLYSKDVIFCPLSNAQKEVNVKLVQNNPLPLCILAISSTVSLQEVEAQ